MPLSGIFSVSKRLRAGGIFTSGRLRFLAGRGGAEIIPTKKPGVLMLVRIGRFTGQHETRALEVLAFLVRTVRVKKRVDFTALAGLAGRTLETKLLAELKD